MCTTTYQNLGGIGVTPNESNGPESNRPSAGVTLTEFVCGLNPMRTRWIRHFWIGSVSRAGIPTWAPDWRIRLRPLAMTAFHGEQYRCPSTSVSTTPDFAIDNLHGKLCVRARKIDRIRYCGLPYCESVCRSFGKNAYQIICHWYALACAIVGATDNVTVGESGQ